jgi:hypothetical protein
MTIKFASYTLKQIGLLPNLCPGEERLKFRIDLPNLKKIGERLVEPFRFGKSIRNLKDSFPEHRFGNKPICFRVYVVVILSGIFYFIHTK